MAPDLRASSMPVDDKAFAYYVREGALTGKGMPVYPNITDEQITALMHYIRQQANAAPASAAPGVGH